MNYSIHVALLLVLVLSGCDKPPAAKPQPPLVTVVEPIQKDVPLFHEYIGHVEANINVELQSQVSGLLIEQHFLQGDEVKEGDLLFIIDPRPFVAALQKAEGVLDENIANLKFAEETVKRNTPLVKQQFISQLNYDQLTTNVKVNKALIEQNLADVETAKINLEYCYIKSPMDGVTGNVQNKVGNLIQVAESPPLVTINQIVPILVSIFIPEKDLPQVLELHKKKTLEAEVHNNGHVFPAVLTLIDNQVQESTGTILLQVTVSNLEKLLWPGQFATVRLILGEAKNALLLPVQAVQIGQQGHYVFVVRDNNTVELRPIKIGQREKDGSALIITSGLKAKEKVVLEGQINLSPDMQVTIKK